MNRRRFMKMLGGAVGAIPFVGIPALGLVDRITSRWTVKSILPDNIRISSTAVRYVDYLQGKTQSVLGVSDFYSIQKIEQVSEATQIVMGMNARHYVDPLGYFDTAFGNPEQTKNV